MTALVAALDAALLHFVWQGVAAAVVLWTALAALRRRSANARYVAACAALGLLAVAPVVTAWLAYPRMPSAQDAPFRIVMVATAGLPLIAPFDWMALARAWMLPVWSCGVLLLSMRMLWGCAKVATLKRQGAVAEPAVLALVERLARRIRVTRPVRVLISTLADGPSVVGWIRPVLLLPAATLLGLNPEQLEAVLAHELAHIRRYDYLANMAQMLMETLFFYHPAVWWISKRMREERELCCDDIAVRTCGDAVCYARALATLERMRVIEPGPSFNAALGAKDGPLRYRIERLLGVARREPAPSRLPGMVAICLGLACFAPVMNPAKAQAPLVLPTPAPPAAPVAEMQAPRVASLRRPAVALQVAPAPQPVPPLTGPVRVEVTVDVTGAVADAKVIDGPIKQRRAALFAALNMRFPATAAPTTREVTVLANADPFVDGSALPRGVARFVTAGDAQERIAADLERIAKLKAQQATASERGAAQLQESIDGYNASLENLQRALASQTPLAGRTLAEIRIEGPEDARQRLPDLLPVQVHGVLSDASMDAAIRLVKQLYPYTEAFFGVTASGDAIFVVRSTTRVVAPVR